MKTMLDFYVFKIRMKREEEYYPLDNIENTDFITSFRDYHNWINRFPQDDDINEKIFTFNQRPEVLVDNDGDDFFAFTRFNIGNYGYKSEINDKDTGENLFTQETDHASTYPLLLGLGFQSGMETGIIALQQEGSFAMKTQFLKSFTNFLNATDTNLMLKMNSYLPEEVIKEMIGGASLKKIKFIKYNANRDEARNLGFTPEEIRAELQYVIKDPDDGRMRTFLNSFIRNVEQNRANFVELDNFDYDTFSIVADVNGSNKTFYPGDFDHIRGTIDVSDEIDYDVDNRAEYESLRATTKRHLNDFIQELMV